jgi:hypothetical protein
MRRAIVVFLGFAAFVFITGLAWSQTPATQNVSQGTASSPPLRGAPDGRLGGVSHDMAIAEQRVALVVGNGAYRHAETLANPVNDANAMAETLRGLGFEVVEVTDADRTAMVKALGQFRKALRTDGVGLFYYAGHGIQARGKNYLVPIDADIADENDVSLLAIDLDSVQYAMEDSGVRLSLYILDACRDDPFKHKVRGIGARGLAPVEAARGSVIVFATAPGHTAADGTGDHGLYTGQLLKTVTEPGLELEDVLKKTAEGVEQASGNQQTPWYNSAFHGHFFFSPVTVNIAAAPDPRSEEFVFWESIKSSTDPADFEAFLKQFPNSGLSSLAERRIAALRAPPPLATPSATVEQPPMPEGEASWSLEQKREVQHALQALGHYQGEADGGFGVGTRAAIKEFQAFEGGTETGTLTEDEHHKLLTMAQRLAVLLDQPPNSPEGATAASVKGDARYARGWAAENGKGAKQDAAEAFYWYALAGTEGDAKALTNLGTLLVRGQGGSAPDPLAAALLWHAAAARGDAVAMYNLGALYERGIGVDANVERAKAWYRRAAAHNHADARAALKRLGG